MVHSAQQVTDVWGMDLVKANLGNDLAHEDINDWLGLARQIPDENLSGIALAYFLGYASKMGLKHRFGFTDLEPTFEQETQRLESLVDQNDMAIVTNLTDYYQKMPLLSNKPAHAIRQLERATQEVAVMIGMPINPQIVTVNGEHVWQVE